MVELQEAFKVACARAYESDLAQALLGPSFHPGGLNLTDRLADLVGIGPGDRVVDVASGRGTTAIHLSRTRECQVVGVEYSGRQVAVARQAAADARAPRATFVEGDAGSLPLGDAGADVLLCECSLCLFPDKAAAAREMLRVLRPGGRLALADLVLDPDHLPEGWRGWLARVACVADARPAAAYAALFDDAGFDAVTLELHPDELLTLIAELEARVEVLQSIAARGNEEAFAIRPGIWNEVRARIAGGEISYALMSARRPA
jgi:SAM-dependent methyltransferase